MKSLISILLLANLFMSCSNRTTFKEEHASSAPLMVTELNSSENSPPVANSNVQTESQITIGKASTSFRFDEINIGWVFLIKMPCTVQFLNTGYEENFTCGVSMMPTLLQVEQLSNQKDCSQLLDENLKAAAARAATTVPSPRKVIITGSQYSCTLHFVQFRQRKTCESDPRLRDCSDAKILGSSGYGIESGTYYPKIRDADVLITEVQPPSNVQIVK